MTETYQKILDVSANLMHEKGYHGTSIQMIADKVGITKSTTFHYFKSKEGILFAILNQVVPSFLEGLREIVLDKDINGLKKLRKFFEFHLDQIGEKGAIINLLLSESRYLSGEKKETFEKSQRDYANYVYAIVRQVQNENPGVFAGLNPKIVTNGILGMCNWSLVWMDPKKDRSASRIADVFYAMIMDKKVRWRAKL